MTISQPKLPDLPPPTVYQPPPQAEKTAKDASAPDAIKKRKRNPLLITDAAPPSPLSIPGGPTNGYSPLGGGA